ncbi:MAG: hypothetical protein V1802_01635, partial [Candidatus Aenigmatarchaeota archaeon]
NVALAKWIGSFFCSTKLLFIYFSIRRNSNNQIQTDHQSETGGILYLKVPEMGVNKQLDAYGYILDFFIYAKKVHVRATILECLLFF